MPLLACTSYGAQHAITPAICSAVGTAFPVLPSEWLSMSMGCTMSSGHSAGMLSHALV